MSKMRRIAVDEEARRGAAVPRERAEEGRRVARERRLRRLENRAAHVQLDRRRRRGQRRRREGRLDLFDGGRRRRRWRRLDGVGRQRRAVTVLSRRPDARLRRADDLHVRRVNRLLAFVLNQADEAAGREDAALLRHRHRQDPAVPVAEPQLLACEALGIRDHAELDDLEHGPVAAGDRHLLVDDIIDRAGREGRHRRCYRLIRFEAADPLESLVCGARWPELALLAVLESIYGTPLQRA
mmetsp:Transcript_26253/g.79683  ORF Transcript_26253/g.79683 Transcript_26253/m.79683 type:complete len:240 (+) Transcript_26253:1694-2413(+)